MSDVLFLGVPSHGHVNPTIGLVSELVRQGERVTYFASLEFKDRIEKAGAVFRDYAQDLDLFKPSRGNPSSDQERPLLRILRSGNAIIADILAQTRGQRFDYLIHSSAFPFAKPMTQILKVPTVSSLAIFFGLEAFFQTNQTPGRGFFQVDPQQSAAIRQWTQQIADTYGVAMPGDIPGIIFNRGDLNLVYTSRYFAGNLTHLNDTFKFVGPPVCDRQERVDFPLEKLTGKQVLYISLGTVFGGHRLKLYDLFFESFAHWEGVVVMAAYGVDHSAFAAPDNFIVRDYVPQHEVLKCAAAAITHAGMNSLSDLLAHRVPFVSLPLGADQPLLAARTQELGATIVLDVNTLEPAELLNAVTRVIHDPSYAANIQKISDSFTAAGGYPKAVEEIFHLKRDRNINR